ncbi:MAG: FAD-dependent oxidoreductase [Planctomyces sp.]|nr:FAD-dependent oxidoreductase [Planctomyces sp.]
MPGDHDPRTGLSRRRWLQSLAAAPLAGALAGCQRPLPFEGEIVGASLELGHRLRSPSSLSTPPADVTETDVLIVGGGLAGLSAAWRLLRRGVERILVLELEPRPGGTATFGESSVTAYPWGAHYVPTPFPENHDLIELLAEIGAIESVGPDGTPVFAEQHLCREPEERLYLGGEWHSGLYPEEGASVEDLRQLAAFRTEIERWVALRDSAGRPAFAVPTSRSSEDPAVRDLDRISMAEWMDQRGFTSPRLRWLVDYSCRDDYGSALEQTSAWAGCFYFAARVREAGQDSQPLLTWPEGLGRIVRHVAGELGDRLRTGVAVMRVNPGPEDSAGPISVTALSAADGTPLRFAARSVILATPQFLVPRLLAELPEDRKAACAEFEYGSWLVANIHLKDRPPSKGFEAAWDNVLYDSRSLGYVVATHQSGRDHGPTVWTWYQPLCDERPHAARQWLMELTWEAAAQRVLEDLAPAHPGLAGRISRLDVMRWGHAMIRARPGFLTGAARELAARPWRGVHFAGTDLSGIPLFEEAQFHGVRAAEEVLASLGMPAR